MRCELVFGAQGPHQVGLCKRDGQRGYGRREAHTPRFVLLRSEGLGRQEHIGESEHRRWVCLSYKNNSYYFVAKGAYCLRIVVIYIFCLQALLYR